MPAGDQSDDQDRKQHRFANRQRLEKGERNGQRRQDQRNPPGTVEPVNEPATGDDQEDADHRADEMGAFDQRQWNEGIHQVEASIGRRRHAGEYQHGAKHDRQRAEHDRRDP